MHRGDIESSMLKQRPTLDIARSNQYHVQAQLDKVIFHLIESMKHNIAELYDLHQFESAAENLEFIDALLADNTYLSLVAQNVEAGVHGPNPTQRESEADHEGLVST